MFDKFNHLCQVDKGNGTQYQCQAGTGVTGPDDSD